MNTLKQQLDLTPIIPSSDVRNHITPHHEGHDLEELVKPYSNMQHVGASVPVGNGDNIDSSQFEISDKKEEENANS